MSDITSTLVQMFKLWTSGFEYADPDDAAHHTNLPGASLESISGFPYESTKIARCTFEAKREARQRKGGWKPSSRRFHIFLPVY